MATIFISYAREDVQVAKKLYDNLKKDGFNPWLDQEDLLPGQDWVREIKSTIDKCSIFMPLVSINSATKKGFYQGEIRHAFDVSKLTPPGQIFIIPARVDSYDPSNHPFFSHLNFADLHPDYDLGYKKIINSLNSSIGKVKINHINNDIFRVLQDDLCLYLPLKINIDDFINNSTSVKIVPCQDYTPPTLQNDGIFFDGSYVVQVETNNLPVKNTPRTVSVWLKFIDNLPLEKNTDTPKFVFSYGEETHDKAFGLFYGRPFFHAANSCRYGLRIFTWCHPYLYEMGNTGCDSEAFSTAIMSNWYHVCISYDGYTQKAYINGELYLTENRAYETGEANKMNIGGFLPGREIPYRLYNFKGYLREFMTVGRVLDEREIMDVYTSTRLLL
jgi:hypothetical protein